MIYIGAYCNTDNKLLEFDVNLLVVSLVYGWQGIIAGILLNKLHFYTINFENKPQFYTKPNLLSMSE